MTRLFVVEDSPSQAALMENLLSDAGYDVSLFGNGKEAFAAIDHRPDLIVSDIWMPEMDGLALCRTIKGRLEYRDIPIILVTSSNKSDELLSGLNALADGFLNKPFNAHVLLQTISTLLQRKQAGTILPPATSTPLNVTWDGKDFQLIADRARVFDFFSIALLNASVQTRALEEREKRLKETNAELARHVTLLSASDERLRSLIAAVPDIVYRLDPSGHFTFLNEAINRLGYTTDELLGQHFSALVHPDDLPHSSLKIVLPALAGRTMPCAPKLFDERRTRDRMTVGLRIRLVRKDHLYVVHELRSVGATHVHVEVNSMGMYGDTSCPNPNFVGTVGVIRDITEQLRVEHELMRARETAESASQAKSEFLSSMSHELRTPLNAILGFSQLLDSQDDPLSDNHRQYLKHVIDGGHHLLRLIDDVLDLARIEAGSSTLDLRAVTPAPLIEFALDATQSLANERQITLQDRTTVGLPRIRVDSTRMRQVLLNLLTNAIKYNRPKGLVTLECGEQGGFLRISVTDTGPGISDDRMKELFQPFNRLGYANSKIEGTGIGLVITKRLVEEMGGRIGIESQPGVGTTFWTDLVIEPDECSPLSIPSPPHPLPGLSPPEFDRQISVLYVEDNNVNALLMRRYLARIAGLDLAICETAEEGIMFARARRPDLILMDVRLPGMNGVDAIRLLRSCTETQHIPIIAVTADAMSHDVRRAMEAGSACHLAKPIDLGELYERIRETVPA